MSSSRRRTAMTIGLAAACIVGCGSDPPAMDAILDQVAYVDTEFRLELRASDPDGQTLTFGFAADIEGVESHAHLEQQPGAKGATFVYSPLASELGIHAFDFTASNGSSTARQTVSIEVKRTSSGARPVFRKPAGDGAILNLATATCITVDIVVEDPDSAEVTISQEGELAQSATLKQRTGLTATWEWCPTAEEIDAKDRYLLKLVADDGTIPRWPPKDFAIALRRVQTGTCPGEPPVISHNPQLEALTQEPFYYVEASVEDDLGLKDAPLVYYSLTPPASPPALEEMTQLKMELLYGDLAHGRWAAQVPNPVGGKPAGATATVHYVIVAQDDDDATGTCDHTTEDPPGDAYQVTITSPGSTCQDDSFEDDDDATQARSVDLEQGQYVSAGNAVCFGDDDWYQIYLFAGETLHATLAFEQSDESGNLDFHLYRDVVGSLEDLTRCTEYDETGCTGNGQSTDANENFVYQAPSAGHYYLVVHGWYGAQNAYDLCIGLTAGACPSLP